MTDSPSSSGAGQVGPVYIRTYDADGNEVGWLAMAAGNGTPPPRPPEPEPEPEGGVSIDHVAYGMFNPVERTDGRWKDGHQVGVAPWGAHEALPVGGNPQWDWYHGTRFGANPPWDKFIVPWGQLFAADGNTEWNLRLQVRNVTVQTLHDDGWRDVLDDIGDAKMNGDFWDSKFRGQESTEAEQGIRDESGNGGGWSVRLASMRDKPNYVTWHWFYSDAFYPRPPVPQDTRAVFVAAEMRLIPDGNGDPDRAKLIASFAADHWPVGTGGKPEGKQITAFLQSRMTFLDSSWSWHTGHTFLDWFGPDRKPVDVIDDSNIRANPPPLVDGG